MGENSALVALLQSEFAGRPAALRQRLLEGDSPRAILAEVGHSDAVAAAQIASWQDENCRMITFLDQDYPAQLLEVHDFPLVVFVRGQFVPDDYGVCVVGSRAAGGAALDAAREVATLLVSRGVSVVSGLAKGVDAAALSAALDAGGRAVAVIGTGIDRYYPATSKPIQQRIEEAGLVLSQFWPGATGNKMTFPMRNAVMSAYGRVTIILAADETSGTRHQARQALAHGRPLILARRVAEDTTWGRAYSSDSANQVAVAGSAAEAADLAMELAARKPLALLPG